MVPFKSSNLTQKPLIKINIWLQEACNSNVALPHAMNLSTVDSTGQPTSRIVLLKSLSDNGITFYTDYTSSKGKDLISNPKAALNLWWAKTNKQIRIEGVCVKTSKKESDAYFQSRPRGSQISAKVSKQSRILESHASLLQEAKDLKKTSVGKEIIRPQRWGGFRLKPSKIEFWINETNRLHKRELFILTANSWERALLSP